MPLVATNIVSALQADPSTPQAIKDRLTTEEGRRQIAGIASEEMLAAFRARYPAIAEAAAEEYRRNFSEAELKAIIAFYDRRRASGCSSCNRSCSSAWPRPAGRSGRKRAWRPSKDPCPDRRARRDEGK